MAVTDGFYALPPEDQETWKAQYGNSAPYFWAAESGNLQVPPEAQGFFNLPPDQQDDWYGEYGEDAANVWLQQSQAAGTGGTGGTGSTGGTGAGGTAVPPVVKTILGGRYADSYAGHTVRKGDPGPRQGIGFGQTVAPSTWNAAMPSQGRSEGWGTIGAGTAGIEYGYGVPGFGKAPIKIDEKDLPHLSNAKLAPGYIPGSGTYNQYDLSKGGLFGTVRGDPSGGIVNTRYGLGGTGDPTTGHEEQTARKWTHGTAGGGGLPLPPPPPDAPISVDPSTVSVGPVGQSWTAGGGGGGGGGTGGGEVDQSQGFFGPGPGYSPSEMGSLWGQNDATRGLDYIITLFMRSDTPTGVGTPAWSAPIEYWNGLITAIRSGMVVVKNKEAWNMLGQKIPGTTPQSIGGKATSKDNIQPNGSPGTGEGSGAGGTGAGGTPNPQFGVSGTLAEGTQTAFGTIQGGLAQGFGLEYHRILEDRARREAEMALEQAKLTGVFNGLPTLQAKELEEKIKQNAFENSIKTSQENRAQKQQDLDEAFRRAELEQNIAVKREEIANLRRTGDLDRAQREEQALRELEFQKQKSTGYVGGQATVELQTFLAKQQQDAYERAANPARAFENELARGATGWNQPGTNAAAAGVAGVTAPGQTLDEWYKAGGYGQNTQPGQGATQPYGYGYGQAGGTTNTAPGYGGTAQGQAGTPVYGEQAQAYQQQAGAQQQQAQSAAQTQQAAQPQIQQTQAPAAQTTQQAQTYKEPAAAGASAYGAQGGGAQPQLMAAYLANGIGGGGTGGGRTDQQWGTNISTPAVAPQPAVGGPLIRTPAAVQAFRFGSQMPTAGNYGVSNQLLSANQAALTERDVRTQNLKQTRKMAPAVRALIGSYAAAGGTDEETFKYHGQRKAPAAATAGAGYNLR